jgi:hypothetical protein
MAPLYSRVEVIAPINRLCLPNAMFWLKLILFPKLTLVPKLLLFLIPTRCVGMRNWKNQLQRSRPRRITIQHLHIIGSFISAGIDGVLLADAAF